MKQKKRVDWKLLVLSFVIVYLLGYIGSVLSGDGAKSEWFESIRPVITPPNWVFPVVWNILFFLIGLSFYFVLVSEGKDKTWKIVVGVFVINFILNAGWSYIFFQLRNPLLAFLDLILLFITIAMLMYFSWSIDKRSSYLLVPYFVWICIAGVLNWVIL